jgi:hypothetical protein
VRAADGRPERRTIMKISRIFVCTAVIAVVALGAISAVEADEPACIPGPGEACVFTEVNFQGGWGRIKFDNPSNGCLNGMQGTYFHPTCFPVGVIDNGSKSIITGPGTRVRICFDPYYSGMCFDLDPDTPWNNLGSWNNQISSYRVDWVDSNHWECKSNNIVGLFSLPQYTKAVGIYDLANVDGSGDCTVNRHLNFSYLNAGVMGLRDETMSSIMLGKCASATICRDPHLRNRCSTFFNSSAGPVSVNMAGSTVGNNTATSMMVTRSHLVDCAGF